MSRAPVVAFALATVPDVDAARRLHDFGTLDDAGVARALGQQYLQRTGHERLPAHLCRIVAIGVACRDHTGLRIYALDESDSDEASLLRTLFELAGRGTAVPVNWDSDGMQRAVVNQRALLHGIGADDDWRSRYVALAPMLAGGGMAPMSEFAALLGLPRPNLDGEVLWSDYQAGRLDSIRTECARAATTTFSLYLRYLRLHGIIDTGQLMDECARVDTVLAETDTPQDAVEAQTHPVS